MSKKLTVSETDKKIFGVCGGIAEYFEVDSSLVRSIWVIVSLIYGFGVLAYVACAFIIPRKSRD